MNVSLTQTLSRTLMTSGTTLMVVLMLYIFGGAMQGSLAMLTACRSVPFPPSTSRLRWR